MSGEHVVYGFLGPLISKLNADENVIILHYESQLPPEELKAVGVTTFVVSDRWKHWVLRAAWEVFRLPSVVKKQKVDQVLNVSGAITPFLAVPQLSLAMNPWGFVKAARSSAFDEIKAFLQRRGYRYAFRKAAHMIYISSHLRDLYRQASKDLLEQAAPSTIAYVGLDNELFDAAQEMKQLTRNPYSILSVSAFAPWKGVHTLIEALYLLRQRKVPATLSLVGPWPDQAYKLRIEELILDLGLAEVVTVHGKLNVKDLHRQYAIHQVYCLMSSCESFGIPAAEAMAFGTPIVSTSCCAIGEICKDAGMFGPVNDPQWTAQALEHMLTNQAAWAVFSENARNNALKLSWDQCSAIFSDIPELRSSSASNSTVAPLTASTTRRGSS